MAAPPDLDSIPLARPEIGAREEELILEVLRSGRLSLGPVGERFEREFAAWLGVDDAVTPPAARPRCTSACGRSAGGPGTRS